MNPGSPEASVYGEYEQDVTNWGNRVLALGGDLRVNNRTKLYARHELLSSIAGRYLLTDDHTQNSTTFGIESEYTRDAHVFSEYRSFDGLSGRETEAAIGLRNRWQVARGVALHTSFENIRGLAGRADRNSTAVTSAIEYSRDPRWLGSARLEYRKASSTDSFLGTLGLARRLSNDWTMLGKYIFSSLAYQTGGSRTQQRVRLGLAYRDTRRDFLNGLLRYEFLSDRDSTTAAYPAVRTVHIASTDWGVQLARRTELRARYALKHVNDQTNNLADSLTTHLVGGRLTQDIGSRLDFGLNGNSLLGEGGGKWAVGLEGGYLLSRDLWLSGGYNWSGFRDEELAADAYTDQGPYLRLRFKFDEGLFR
ncbi:MAG: hypothetical protein HUU35_03550 [Armatimonadetes bacterium]|nr:hypothetical protein [Armatimonadota bacterium]